MTIIANLWPMKFVILATNDQPLKWVLDSNWFVGKLEKWDFSLQENNFDVKHRAMTINKDVDGLNRKPSSSDLDIIRTYWHEGTNLEMMHEWHVISVFCILAKWLPTCIMSSSREFFRHFGVFKGGTWWHYIITKHVFCIGFFYWNFNHNAQWTNLALVKIIKSFFKKIDQEVFFNMLACLTWLKWQMYYMTCPLPHVVYVKTILINMIIEYSFDMIKMNYVLVVSFWKKINYINNYHYIFNINWYTWTPTILPRGLPTHIPNFNLANNPKTLCPTYANSITYHVCLFIFNMFFATSSWLSLVVIITCPKWSLLLAKKI